MSKPHERPDIAPDQPLEGYCNARKTDGSGHLCRHEAGWGTDHAGFGYCKLHGGKTPGGQVHGQRLREAKILGPLLERHRDLIGENPDPYQGVLEVVCNGWAWVRVLEARVAELVDQEGVADAEGLYAPDHLGDLRPHVLVSMLTEARREHRRNCAEAIRAGIAERMVSIAEDQADLLAQVLRGVLEELGVWDRPDTPEVVRRHLRALPAGGTAA